MIDMYATIDELIKRAIETDAMPLEEVRQFADAYGKVELVAQLLSPEAEE